MFVYTDPLFRHHLSKIATTEQGENKLEWIKQAMALGKSNKAHWEEKMGFPLI